MNHPRLLEAAFAVAGVLLLTSGCTPAQPAMDPGASGPPCAPDKKQPYRDGTFVGTKEESKHGTVTVTATVKSGCIISLSEELNPADGQSKQIQKQAIPLLREAVRSANSAAIDTISGATYTYESYRTSLQAALDQSRK